MEPRLTEPQPCKFVWSLKFQKIAPFAPILTLPLPIQAPTPQQNCVEGPSQTSKCTDTHQIETHCIVDFQIDQCLFRIYSEHLSSHFSVIV